MKITTKVLISCACVVVMVNLASAMYGLCSTEHMDSTCNDVNDRCVNGYNGNCTYGAGDHNEGCQCIVESYENGKLVKKIMKENHLPIVKQQTNKNKPKPGPIK